MFVKFLRQFSLNILALAIITTPTTVSMNPTNHSAEDILTFTLNVPYIIKLGTGTLQMLEYKTLSTESPGEIAKDEVWCTQKIRMTFTSDKLSGLLSTSTSTITTDMPIDKIPIKIEGGFVSDCNGLTSSGDTIVKMQQIPIPDQK